MVRNIRMEMARIIGANGRPKQALLCRTRSHTFGLDISQPLTACAILAPCHHDSNPRNLYSLPRRSQDQRLYLPPIAHATACYTRKRLYQEKRGAPPGSETNVPLSPAPLFSSKDHWVLLHVLHSSIICHHQLLSTLPLTHHRQVDSFLPSCNLVSVLRHRVASFQCPRGVIVHLGPGYVRK